MGVPRRVLLLMLVGALVASGLSALLAAQYVRSLGGEPRLFPLFFLNGAFWFGWLALAPFLIALSRRSRLDRSPRVAVPAHIAGILAAAVAHVALQSAVRVALAWGGYRDKGAAGQAAFGWAERWMREFPQRLAEMIDWEIMAGAAIVGIAHASFYYRESQDRALRESQLETQLVAAQLQMLQRQLQPHFLFNTLHAISALMHRDVDAADRMLVRLGELLRLTLDTLSRPDITLREEMAFVEKYLQIEQVRLGSRLEVTLDIDAELLDALVPALLLQPLVENAIRHGIAPQAAPGRVTVTARRDGDMLVMTVDDSGPGPSEDDMATLSTGIGVSNTRARLRHQFGTAFRFDLRKRPDTFQVLVAVPFRLDGDPSCPSPTIASPQQTDASRPQTNASAPPKPA